MDEQLRKLDRQAADGDEEARRRADIVRLRSGEAPSWAFLLEEQRRVTELNKQYLLEAIKQDLAAFFQKHPNSGIKGLLWDTLSYEDGITSWDVEGLFIDIDPAIWHESCHASTNETDFEAESLVEHLKDNCCCSVVASRCYIGTFDWISEDQRQALRAALEDVIQLAIKLDNSPRDLVYPGAQHFSYYHERGFLAETLVEHTLRRAAD